MAASIHDSDFVSRFIADRLMARGLLREPVPLRRYSQGADDPDSKLVFLSKERPDFVVTVSPVEFPEVVAEECQKALEMRQSLGALSTPILEPIDTGRIDAASYAVLPYRKPLWKVRGLRWIDRVRMRRRLLKWLLRIAQERTVASDISRYEKSLEALTRLITPDSPTARMLGTAAGHVRSGGFAPQSAPMHGDLWIGNVLRGVDPAPFTLIDWRGSTVDGFPIFDLVRTAGSFGMSSKALHRELRLHRDALGCEPPDLPVYVLGGLGHYAERLGEMSPTLFRTMADECVTRLTAAMQ